MARLGVRFKIPLESAGVDLSQLQKEFREIIQLLCSPVHNYLYHGISVSGRDYIIL